MKKIIIVAILLALSSVTYAANKDDEYSKHESHVWRISFAFCSQKIYDIDTVASSIKGADMRYLDLLKDSIKAGKDKDYSKKVELDKYIKEYEDKIAAQTHLLADIVSIYHAAGCDMVEAMQHMYCPSGWSKDCEWVYRKSDKSKVKSNP